MQGVKEAVGQALAQAQLSNEEIDLIYGGLTGADWPEEYGMLREAVGALHLCDRVHITNDSIVAMRGGTEKSYGAILVAGTGANCAVRAPDGREFLYHYYHDEHLQGGSALGASAVKAVMRAETGRGPATSLRPRLLAVMGFNTVDDLVRKVLEGWQAHFMDFKDLAPIVFEEAYAGDPVASGIIHDFGKGSAELVTAALRRFEMTDVEIEVVLSGSIFKGVGSLLTDTLKVEIHRVAPKARLVNARYEPVVGAVLLGFDLLGIQIEGGVKANIALTAKQLGLERDCFPL